MGVNISDLVQRHPTNLAALGGKSVAFDAFNILYQFLASIRQEDGTPLADFKGNPTGHLSGLFYRNARLLENGIKPVYVFDGEPPSFKAAEIARRKDVKKEAEAKWREALDYGRLEEAKRFAQATSRLTPAMVSESRELLSALGIPCVQAPSEGEAQAAHMAMAGAVYASASQDYDSLLFGAPRLVRNLSITGKRKVPRQNRFVLVEPEEITLSEVLSSLGLSREGLVLIGILSGTDFNNGVKGVGPKTALKIVRENPSLAGIKSHVKSKYNYEFEEDAEAILDFFMNPPVSEPSQVKLGRIDRQGLTELLVGRHDFSEERVDRVLDSLEKGMAEKNSQKKMGEWL